MSMSPYTVYVKNRPIRTGFLIDTSVFLPGTPRFEDLLDEIIRHNYRLWGGRLNPIVFFSNESLQEEAWNHLENVDVDCIRSFSPLPKNLVKQLDERLQPWSIDESKLAVTEAPIRVESYGIVTPPTPQHLQIFGDAKFILFDFSPDCEPSVQRFIHRNFGTYSQWIGDKNSIRREAWLEDLLCKINVERILVSDRKSLADALTLLVGRPPNPTFKAPLRFITPVRLSSLQLPELLARSDKVYDVIIGDTPSDLAEFWNGAWWKRICTTPYLHQIWLPSELATDPSLHDALKNWLRYYCQVGSSDAKIVEFISSSLSLSDLNNLKAQICDGGPWSPRGRIAQAESLKEERRESERLLSTRRKVILSDTGSSVRYSGNHDRETFSLAKPELLAESIVSDGIWAVDVKIELSSPDFKRAPDQSWWMLPRVNSGGLMNAMFNNSARVNSDGFFSVRVENHSGPYARLVKPELKIHLPEFSRIIPLLITRPDYEPLFTNDARCPTNAVQQPIVRVQYSDKGDYLRGLIRVFGNFNTARQFCERRFWRYMFLKLANVDARKDSRLQQDIINVLKKPSRTTDQYENQSGRILGLIRGRAKRSLALTYSEFKQELDELSKTPLPAQMNYLQGDSMVSHHGVEHLTETEMKDGLDHLLELNVLRPGAYVRCSLCGIENWYLVDDLKQRVRCLGCDHSQSIGIQQEWSYMLNSLAEISIIQGQLPVMQAFEVLSSSMVESFFFSPSLELFKANSEKPWHEVDVLAIVNGKFIVGEVKGGERTIKPENFHVLAEIAEALHAQRAIMFLPHGRVTAEALGFLDDIKKRLSPIGIGAEIYELPTF